MRQPKQYSWLWHTHFDFNDNRPVSLVIVFAGILVFGLVLALILTFRQLAAGSRLSVTVERMDTLSVERYRPMLRLLDQTDLLFLKTQPGFNPPTAARLRRQRCDIFSGYLSDLAADFQLTCSALKLLTLQAEDDRPDLANSLIRAQAAFYLGLLRVRFRLALYRIGFSSVDVSGLLRLFGGMRIEIRNLVPCSAESAA